MGTSVFSVCVVNQMMAVCNTKYQQISENWRAHFLRERAKYNCEVLLSIQSAKSVLEALQTLKQDSFGTWPRVLFALPMFFCCMHDPFHQLGVAAFLALMMLDVQSAALTGIGRHFTCDENGSRAEREDLFLFICHRQAHEER